MRVAVCALAVPTQVRAASVARAVKANRWALLRVWELEVWFMQVNP